VIFSNPRFLLLWVGQVLSQAGIRMYQIAIIWWVLTAGGRGTGREVGFFMVMGALPSVLFIKLIGKTIDRTPSKRILVTADLLASCVLASVAVFMGFSKLALWGVYLAGFLTALMQAFVDPTLNRAVAELVEPQEIERAVAFQTSTQSLANFGGAVAGALLIGRLGIHGVVILNVGSYLVSALCSSLIRFRKARAPVAEDGPSAGLSGWKMLDGTPLLRRLLLGFGFVNFFCTPILVILPLYTNKTLGADAATLGMLEAGLWIGILAGTFSSSLFAFVENTIRLAAACLFTLGLCLLLPGLVVHKHLYLVLLFGGGFSVGVNNVRFISLFQRVIRQDMKGRFFALMQGLIAFAIPMAYALFGLLADRVSPTWLCLAQGGCIMALGAWFLSLADREPELTAA
jgi:MFS family permease